MANQFHDSKQKIGKLLKKKSFQLPFGSLDRRFPIVKSPIAAESFKEVT